MQSLDISSQWALQRIAVIISNIIQAGRATHIRILGALLPSLPRYRHPLKRVSTEDLDCNWVWGIFKATKNGALIEKNFQFLILAVCSSFCLSEGHLCSWGNSNPSYLTAILLRIRQGVAAQCMQRHVTNPLPNCNHKQSYLSNPFHNKNLSAVHSVLSFRVFLPPR